MITEEMEQVVIENTDFWTRHQAAVCEWLKKNRTPLEDAGNLAERAAVEFDWLGAGIGLGLYLYLALDVENEVVDGWLHKGLVGEK